MVTLTYFILFEFRTTSSVVKPFTASVAGCVAACVGKPKCPGVTFEGNADLGTCNLINGKELKWSPFQRSNTRHVLLRRGFLVSYPVPDLIKAANTPGSKWSATLSEKVVAANEALAMKMTTIEVSDPIWNYIESVPKNNVGTTSQDIPLRKSLYSLGFPTHPKVLEHLRYLKNFLDSEHDTSDLADVLLAFAFKYRNFKSITNSTSTFISQVWESDELEKIVTLPLTLGSRMIVFLEKFAISWVTFLISTSS